MNASIQYLINVLEGNDARGAVNISAGFMEEHSKTNPEDEFTASDVATLLNYISGCKW